MFIPAPAKQVFDFVTQYQNMTTFRGYGPVPGIVSVEPIVQTSERKGSTYCVYNTNGTTHHETVVKYAPNYAYVIEMRNFESPASLIIKAIKEEWSLGNQGQGTNIHRLFTFSLASIFAYPFALIMKIFFYKAVQRDLEIIKESIIS